MERTIEEIKSDIENTKSAIHSMQSKLREDYELLAEAMQRKFTDETGINVGDKFKKTTRSYFMGRVTEVVREGYFTGMSVRYEHICFNYADIKKNGSMSQNTHYEYFYDDEIKKYSLC